MKDRPVKWLQDRPFLILLSVLVPMLVVYPIVRDYFDARILFDALFTFLFVTVFQVIYKKGSRRIFALVLGLLTVMGTWTNYVIPGLPVTPIAIGFHLLAAAFLALSVVTILQTIYAQTTLTGDSIYGAFCGYFLIGLAFGHLYCAVDTLVPESFRGPDGLPLQTRDEVHQRFLLTYFSLVTLTTVGYGDITPAQGAARGLAMVEAVIGQFYLVVLMAELIGIRISQTSSTPTKPPHIDP